MYLWVMLPCSLFGMNVLEEADGSNFRIELLCPKDGGGRYF